MIIIYIHETKPAVIKIISSSKEEILAIIPRDTSNIEILELLISKFPTIKISIGLKVNGDNIKQVNKLKESGVKIYNWDISEEIPMGLYFSDHKSILITVIGSWEKYYQHNIGILIQDNPVLLKGFEFLIQWFFSFCMTRY